MRNLDFAELSQVSGGYLLLICSQEGFGSGQQCWTSYDPSGNMTGSNCLNPDPPAGCSTTDPDGLGDVTVCLA